MSRPLLAVAVYRGLLAFEYSLARELLGLDRTSLVPDWYDFRPCRVERGRLFTSHDLEIRPPGTLAELERADTILVPGWRDPDDVPDAPFLDALRRAHQNGVRIVTICTGAFPLAHAGLLDGRRVTTHWLHAETLRRRFPAVRVDEDALYVHDRDGPATISSSAGCSAGLDLCLALVREDYGVRVANQVARRMVAPVHRDGGQSQYAEAQPGDGFEESFGPVLEWMANHLGQPIAMEGVARQFGFSERTFQRRFRAATSLSPHQWLIQQRVARARELLEASDHNVDQIARLTGLGSPANLRKHLARVLGTTPRAYRAAFRAEE